MRLLLLLWFMCAFFFGPRVPAGAADADSVGATLDYSTPQATFRSLGKAIKADDPMSFLRGMPAGATPDGIAYKQFLEEWNRWKNADGNVPDQAKYFVLSPAVLATGQVADYFLTAEILRDSSLKALKDGTERKELLVRWKPAKILRRELFFRLPGEKNWRWFINPEEQAEFPAADYSTPASAYVSISWAMQFDLLELVCEGIASSAKGGLSDKECVKVLKERLAKQPTIDQKPVWVRKTWFGGYKEILKKESLPPDNGVQVCRIWRLNQNNRDKRDGFEVFAKEGEEWKWLPDRASIWSPKKGQ